MSKWGKIRQPSFGRESFGLVVLGLVMLAGCSMAPKYRAPQSFIPASWPQGDPDLRAAEQPLPELRYAAVFRDPRLQSLVTQALANNMNFRLAIANIAESRANWRAQRASLFPTIDAEGRFTRSRSSTAGRSGETLGTGSSGTGGTGTGTGITGVDTTVGGTDRIRNNFSVSGDMVSWEIDLFGRNRSLTAAEYDLYLASESAARATRLTLVGEVADAYFTLAGDRTQLMIAIETRALAHKGVVLTRQLFEGGLSTRDDLAQAQQIEAQAAASIANYQAVVQQDINYLRLLLGSEPDPQLLPQTLEDVEPLVGDVPAGLSSAILLRRPDVIEAEYRIRSANGQIGAARAAFFPTISLTSAIGFSSRTLGNLFTGNGFNWAVSPDASQTIFDGGRLSANLAYAHAQRQYALANYQSVIQTAFRDVTDALARHATIDQQIAADAAYVDASRTSEDLSALRYNQGLDAFLPVLDAQRTLFQARSNLATDRVVRLTNRSNLYTALGGDSSINALPLPRNGDAELGWDKGAPKTKPGANAPPEAAMPAEAPGSSPLQP